MKKMIVAALLMIGMTSIAQEKTPMAKKEKMEQLTPEQRNELRLKKMTLELGLNTSQQKDMGKIITERSAKMEAAKAERSAKGKAENTKPTADERFARQSKRLDEQIAMNERIKKILTPEQFEKWEKRKEHKKHSMQGQAGKRKMKGEHK
jgi:Spy/CpxP family protein refolding chaperone